MSRRTVWLMLKREDEINLAKRVNDTLAIDIRADFVTRMRSIGKTRMILNS
jgi:hypothetical protein